MAHVSMIACINQDSGETSMTSDNLSRKDVNDGKVASDFSSHPVGTVIGTIAGITAGVSGAVIASAAAGSVIGPVGAAAGAMIGAMVGAGTGHEIAAEVNPKAEDLFWRENYSTRSYVTTGSEFETYQPAYRYGVDTYIRFPDSDFGAIESSLSGDWYVLRGSSKLDWHIARNATRDAFQRLRTNKANKKAAS
jgi:hypothetical protein